MKKRVRVLISGRVQGVGFRYWVKGRAMELDLTGWVRNLEDGKVEAVFEGEREKVKQMVGKCKEGQVLSRVDKVEEIDEELEELEGFEIRRD
jgi:acylphosphatase